MNLFNSLELNSLEDLLVMELEDLFDAEKRLCDALPKMADAASSEELKRAFNEHYQQTKRQVSRLEEIFSRLGRSATRETCDAMKGLIREGSEIISATGDPDVKDAALIGAAQRVEHYEIAGYGTARTFAEHLGYSEVARLLQTTLDEESKTDTKLTQLAQESINVKARFA